MKKVIAVLSNDHMWTFNLRKEILISLLEQGYRVVLVLPYGERVDDLIKLGCEFVDIKSMNRHSMNPINEIKLFFEYKKILKSIKPDVVLTYTIKPNIYGGIVCRFLKIPMIANVTGLGSSLQGGIQSVIMTFLYKIGLKKADTVFFQNQENMNFMVKKHLVKDNFDLLPGSGVDLSTHCAEVYPDETDEMIFVTIGRVMKDKGIQELLIAAKEIKKRYPKVRFQLIGAHDGNCEAMVEQAESEGYIEYLGLQKNVHEFIKKAYATIHASHHEGMANVLLESAATARPIIASNIPGCTETFDEGITGMGFEVENSVELINVIEKFILLPHAQKEKMGRLGRKKMEREFDRNIVVCKYLYAVKNILGDDKQYVTL